MRFTSPEPREGGDFEIYCTTNYGRVWGQIDLDEAGLLRLRDVSVDDCDRLIKAAAAVKEDLLRRYAEMTAPHGRGHFYKGTCQLCGKPEDDELHAEPEAEPLVVSDSTIAQAEALAGDIEAGTWPAPAPSGMQSPAPVVRVIGHPFDAGEGSREISGPGRELLAAAIAEQDAADEAATAGPYARERDEGDADLAAMSGYCPAMTGPDEGLDVTLYCDRQAGHAGSHHAPCRNGGGVAWSDEAALCDSAMPLPNGGELKCTFDGGHYGAHSAHSALGGKRRWVGHGADARTEDGELIATVTA